MKSKSEIQKLLQKFVENSCNEDEIAVIKNYIRDTKDTEAFPEYKSVMAHYKSIPDIDDERTLTIYHNILKVSKRKKRETQRKSVWRYAAAAVVVGVLATTYVFRDNIFSSSQVILQPVIVNNQIQPGSDKATLTLETGETIALVKGASIQTQNATSNGEEIVYEQQSSKESSSRALPTAIGTRDNILTIPRGGQFQLTLADGTKVWLNSETQLKYPVAFIDGETRQVELVYGEAYFDVSPSTAHKGSNFKVFNKAQEIEVLGTEFNIKAYKNETNIYTTLIEGKVAVIPSGAEGQNLVPNQQSNLNLADNNSLTINTVDVYREISWKEGVFSFRDKPLKEVMTVIARWYDMEVVFENKELENIPFNGALKKKQDIINLLSVLKGTNNINYEINDKKVILK